MKKVFIFLYFGLLLTAGPSINEKDITKEKGKLYYNGVVLNGEYTIVFAKPAKMKWESVLSDLNIEYEIYKVSNDFKNGKESGEIRAYGQNDELLFINNKKENGYLAKEFYYNGNIIEKLSRKDKNALEEFFSRTSGKLVEGPYELYYPGGKIKESGTLKIVGLSIPEYSISSSRKNGTVKRYYENGSLKEIITFKDGLREGSSSYYNENGTLAGTDKYVKGLKQ